MLKAKVVQYLSLQFVMTTDANKLLSFDIYKFPSQVLSFGQSCIASQLNSRKCTYSLVRLAKNYKVFYFEVMTLVFNKGRFHYRNGLYILYKT